MAKLDIRREYDLNGNMHKLRRSYGDDEITWICYYNELNTLNYEYLDMDHVSGVSEIRFQ